MSHIFSSLDNFPANISWSIDDLIRYSLSNNLFFHISGTLIYKCSLLFDFCRYRLQNIIHLFLISKFLFTQVRNQMITNRYKSVLSNVVSLNGLIISINVLL